MSLNDSTARVLRGLLTTPNPAQKGYTARRRRVPRRAHQRQAALQFDNAKLSGQYFTTPMEWNGRKNWVSASAAPPDAERCMSSRTCLVLAKSAYFPRRHKYAAVNKHRGQDAIICTGRATQP